MVCMVSPVHQTSWEMPTSVSQASARQADTVSFPFRVEQWCRELLHGVSSFAFKCVAPQGLLRAKFLCRSCYLDREVRPALTNRLLTSSIPTLKPFCTRSVMFPCPPSTVFLAALQMRCKSSDTLLLGTPGILCAWALQGYFAVGHCKDT